MRILIITQLFFPEMGAQANRIYPIAKYMASKGHDVYVATGMPNYPEGVVFPGYTGRFFFSEQIDGFTILRTCYFPTPRNQSKWAQLISYLSFIFAAFHSGLHASKVDVVFITSPPIFSAIAAQWLARLRRAKLVFDIRDLWPDEIIACGAASEKSHAVRFVRGIERRIYRNADCISCTTEAFMDTVAERGVPRERMIYLPNGADLDLFRPLAPSNPITVQHPFGNNFVVMYSGLLGIKHGLETILEAAAALKEYKDIVFYFVGSGARGKVLMERATAMKLDNVLFGGERTVIEIPYLLARADVCVTCLMPKPYLEKIIPVKIFEYMACKKPIVAAVSGEAARIIRESGGGIAVPPGDGTAMANAILGLYRDPALRSELGISGRKFVEEHHSRELMAKRLLKTLEGLCTTPPSDTNNRTGAVSGDLCFSETIAHGESKKNASRNR